MNVSMELTATICLKTFIRNLTHYLTGSNNHEGTPIKVNSENLLKNGDLYFLISLKAWRTVYKCDKVCTETCTTVLQHFLHTQGKRTDGKTVSDFAEEVFQQLIKDSDKWPVNIEKCSVEKDRVCVFLNRQRIVKDAITSVLLQEATFGTEQNLNKVFHFKICEDKESDLTTRRLQLLQTVTEKLLEMTGCTISDENSASRFVFTTKSEGKVESNYQKYVCGVVKNSKSNAKECFSSWEDHIKKRIGELEDLSEHKLFEMEERRLDKDSFVKCIATATATFELLAVKPSRPVLISHNFTPEKNVANTKGASFILYNTARIATILSKYNSKRLKGMYPNLPEVRDIDYTYLQQEDEWELIYNYIVGYPVVLSDCIRSDSIFQTSPQVMCIFLSRLCQKFSVYYRKTRILTEGYDHLFPAMFARLYMIQALHIVLQSALHIFGIKPLSYM